MTKNLPSCALVAFILLALAPPAEAIDPQEPVSATYVQIQAIAKEATDRKVMVQKLDEVLSSLLDYDAFSQRALKGKWRKLSQSKKTRFKSAFKTLILRTYSKRFHPGAVFSVSWREPVVYLDEAKSRAEVRSTVQAKKASADVDYLMGKKGGFWRVHDIIIDDVSMALNWRKQFRRILDQKGFNELVKRIEAKSSR